MDDLPQALTEVQPTLAAAVPRVFEKLYANILQKGNASTGLRRLIFDWAVRVARRPYGGKRMAKRRRFCFAFAGRLQIASSIQKSAKGLVAASEHSSRVVGRFPRTG